MEFQIKDITTERKVDLIGLTIFEAQQEGIVNPMLLDIFFKVNKVLIYSDLEFTMEEKQDKLALFDKFNANGIFVEFNEKLEVKYPGETKFLQHYLDEWTKERKIYLNSFSGVIDSFKTFAENMPQNFSNNMSKLEGVDLSSLSQLVPLAKQFGIDLEQK